MPKQKIGIDIDGTTAMSTEQMIDSIGLYYGEDFNIELIKDSLEDLPGVEQWVINASVTSAVLNYKIPFYKNAEEVIKKLNDNYDIYFISYRPPSAFVNTKKLLDRIGIDYTLTLASRDDGKHDIIKRYGIEVFIDDDRPTIEEINSKTDCTSLVFNQPWNVTIKNSDRVCRVNNWLDIRDYFFYIFYNCK